MKYSTKTVTIFLVILFTMGCASGRLSISHRDPSFVSIAQIAGSGALWMPNNGNSKASGSSLLQPFKSAIEMRFNNPPILSLQSLPVAETYVKGMPYSVYNDRETGKSIMKQTGKRYLIIGDVGETLINGQSWWVIAPFIFVIVGTKEKTYTHPFARLKIIDLQKSAILYEGYFQSDAAHDDFIKDSMKYFISEYDSKGGSI